MKIIRYESTAGAIGYGVQHGSGPPTKLRGDLFEDFEDSGEPVDLVRLRAPLTPAALLCIGLNYRQHAAETKAPLPQFPVLFMKGVNAVQHPGEPIFIPRWMASSKVDFECELAVVIGRTCKNVSRSEALNYVLGYMCANDVSARDWQKEGGGSQWCRGKTFDTFAPLGPCIVTREEIPDPSALHLRTLVNGEVMQDCPASDMIFDVPTLIEFLSGSTTLLPGTVILTGTPHGVGVARQPPRFLKAGDIVTIEISGIGSLTNPVADEPLDSGASTFHL